MKKKWIIIKNLLMVILLIPMIIACNNEENVWNKAKEQNTVIAYQEFIENNPQSKFLPEAEQRKFNLEYTWEDGFLEKKCMKEDFDKINQAFSNIINEKNAIIVGINNVDSGSIITYATSYSGKIKFTSKGAEGMVAISVKRLRNDRIFLWGIKMNDGDKDASLQFYKLLERGFTEKR